MSCVADFQMGFLSSVLSSLSLFHSPFFFGSFSCHRDSIVAIILFRVFHFIEPISRLKHFSNSFWILENDTKSQRKPSVIFIYHIWVNLIFLFIKNETRKVPFAWWWWWWSAGRTGRSAICSNIHISNIGVTSTAISTINNNQQKRKNEWLTEPLWANEQWIK